MANPGMANNAPARMQQCAVGERALPTSRTVMPAEAGIQYSEAPRLDHKGRGLRDHPHSRMITSVAFHFALSAAAFLHSERNFLRSLP
jgi:hypothetical protein